MADFMRRCTKQKITAFATASVLVATSTPLRAGDLNAEVNNMFNNLGAIGNYTAPGAFRGQTFNTYTGGNLMMRSPNKVYQLAAIQFPGAKAGCGGIDVFGGSFSHISAQEFKNMLRNITAALPGIAFQLALEAVSPLLGGLTAFFIVGAFDSLVDAPRLAMLAFVLMFVALGIRSAPRVNG